MVQKNNPGFTMIEIMIALGIGLALTAAVVTTVMQYQKRANRQTTILALKNLKNSIMFFHDDTETYPEKLGDLVKRPANKEVADNWSGPYLEKLPKDAWKKEFKYRPTPDGDNEYELYSYGPDGKKAKKSEWIDVWKQK